MKADITNRSDIQQLIDSFYTKVRADDTIGYLFNDVAKVNWEQHLPRMYDFWESIIFQTGNFRGNPMTAHMALHQRSPLSKSHFDRWLSLFNQTVDELFEGNNAELAKQRALSIATMMQIKIASSNDPHSII
jgi:Truncated hemoglobins